MLEIVDFFAKVKREKDGRFVRLYLKVYNQSADDFYGYVYITIKDREDNRTVFTAHEEVLSIFVDDSDGVFWDTDLPAGSYRVSVTILDKQRQIVDSIKYTAEAKARLEEFNLAYAKQGQKDEGSNLDLPNNVVNNGYGIATDTKLDINVIESQNVNNPRTDASQLSSGIWQQYEKLYGKLDPTDMNNNGIPDELEPSLINTLKVKLWGGRYKVLKQWWADADMDGIPTYKEVFMYHTDPQNPDTDNDTLLDGDELKIGTSPTQFDVFDSTDYDGDGLSAIDEVSCKTRVDTAYTHSIIGLKVRDNVWCKAKRVGSTVTLVVIVVVLLHALLFVVRNFVKTKKEDVANFNICLC